MSQKTSKQANKLIPIIIPADYDYVGVYLTDKCHLSCAYCITQHHKSSYGKQELDFSNAAEWIDGLNRLRLPKNVPITLQGGEPFLYNESYCLI